MTWTALLPLAAVRAAKSRLRAASATDEAHLALVDALRTDTALALQRSTAVARVLVVSHDPVCLAWAARRGFETLVESGAGLNAALRQADDAARRRWPQDAVVAVVGDLPAATGPALDAALGAVAGGRAFVADHLGTGTTMLAARAEALRPLFGAGSAARHAASGARALDVADELRWDVDTPDDLDGVLRLPGIAATVTGRLRLPRPA